MLSSMEENNQGRFTLVSGQIEVNENSSTIEKLANFMRHVVIDLNQHSFVKLFVTHLKEVLPGPKPVEVEDDMTTSLIQLGYRVEELNLLEEENVKEEKESINRDKIIQSFSQTLEDITIGFHRLQVCEIHMNESFCCAINDYLLLQPSNNKELIFYLKKVNDQHVRIFAKSNFADHLGNSNFKRNELVRFADYKEIQKSFQESFPDCSMSFTKYLVDFQFPFFAVDESKRWSKEIINFEMIINTIIESDNLDPEPLHLQELAGSIYLDLQENDYIMAIFRANSPDETSEEVDDMLLICEIQQVIKLGYQRIFVIFLNHEENEVIGHFTGAILKNTELHFYDSRGFENNPDPDGCGKYLLSKFQKALPNVGIHIKHTVCQQVGTKTCGIYTLLFFLDKLPPKCGEDPIDFLKLRSNWIIRFNRALFPPKTSLGNSFAKMLEDFFLMKNKPGTTRLPNKLLYR